MKKTTLLLAALVVALPLFAQNNPCDDPVYLGLAEKDLNEMSEREFDVFSRLSSACTEFLSSTGRALDATGDSGDLEQENRRYSVRGFSLRPRFSSTYWYVDDNRFLTEDSYGGGFGLGFGWGFSELITLYMNFDGASMDADLTPDFGLGHFDLGVRFTFAGTTRRFKPFANVAFTGFGAYSDDWYRPGSGFRQEVGVGGGGMTFGGGFQHFFSTKVALDLALDLTFGEARRFEVDGVDFDRNRDSFTSRFTVGIVWYPWN